MKRLPIGHTYRRYKGFGDGGRTKGVSVGVFDIRSRETGRLESTASVKVREEAVSSTDVSKTLIRKQEAQVSVRAF